MYEVDYHRSTCLTLPEGRIGLKHQTVRPGKAALSVDLEIQTDSTFILHDRRKCEAIVIKDDVGSSGTRLGTDRWRLMRTGGGSFSYMGGGNHTSKWLVRNDSTGLSKTASLPDWVYPDNYQPELLVVVMSLNDLCRRVSKSNSGCRPLTFAEFVRDTGPHACLNFFKEGLIALKTYSRSANVGMIVGMGGSFTYWEGYEHPEGASTEELAAAELARAWLVAGLQQLCENYGIIFYNTTKIWKILLLPHLGKDRIHLAVGKDSERALSEMLQILAVFGLRVLDPGGPWQKSGENEDPWEGMSIEEARSVIRQRYKGMRPEDVFIEAMGLADPVPHDLQAMR